MLLVVAMPVYAESATQEAADREAARQVRLNQAMEKYNAGEYEQAIGPLTGILQADPQDATARFLRGLSHAQLARLDDETRRLAEYVARSAREARLFHEARQGKDEALAEAQREQEALAEVRRVHNLAGEKYRLAAADLDALLTGSVPDPYAMARLVDGVIRAKLAQFTQVEKYEDRLQARRDLLEQAQRSFEAYLNPPAGTGLQAPSGLNKVRARFFLAVVLYRQALRPGRAELDPDETADASKFAEAEKVLMQLDDPQEVEALLAQGAARESTTQRDTHLTWASYANVYLGLIRMRQANREAKPRPGAAKTLFGEAEEYLKRAFLFDADVTYEPGVEPAKSRSGRVVPLLVEDQIASIRKVLEAAAEPTHVEDFMAEWTVGLAYDSNVPLLGDNTIQPRRIPDKDDFRVGTSIALSYTADLGKYDKRLDRWTMALMGRTAGAWHEDIQPYDQQDYGGTAAVRYELLKPWQGKKALQGPLYLSVQYDYDYFLLGNNGFVHVNGIFPHLTLFTCDQRALTDIGFTYEDRDYQEDLTSRWYDRDGDHFTVGATQSYEWKDLAGLYEKRGWQPHDLVQDPDPRWYRQWRYVRPYVGARYGWDTTDGREYDAEWFRLLAGVSVPLPKGWAFLFDGEWEWQDYGSHSKVDFHRRGREDFIQRYGFAVQRRFVLAQGDGDAWNSLKMGRIVMLLRGEISFVDDDSNVKDRLGEAVFSYDRAIYGISATFQFN